MGILTTVQTGKDFFFSIRDGEFSGLTAFLFGGQNPGVTVDREESISPIRLETGTGEVYTYLTTDTTLFASSTDDTDTTTFICTGLDSLFNPITRLVTLDGQTPVALSGTMFRITNVFFISAALNNGNVYISTDDTDITAGVPNTLSKVKARVDAGKGQGDFASFTVPKDKKAYLYNLDIAASKVSDLDLTTRFSFPGSTEFSQGPPFQIFQTGVNFFTSSGFVLTEGTDFDFTMKSPTAQSKVTLQMFTILIDV